MAPKKIRDVIQKFKLALRKAGFPAVRVLVFGSYARGEERKDSDIDICLVSIQFKRNKEKYRKEAVFVAYQTDPRIQLVLAAPSDIKAGSLLPLFSSIFKESIAA